MGKHAAGEDVDEICITDTLRIPLAEVEMKAVRAQGAGGQNVNKVATAIHLRFDIAGSPSLPDALKKRLLSSGDQRISADGVLVIKSQRHRSQERNRKAALQRLEEMLAVATRTDKPRVPTKPGPAARQKRLDEKSRRGELKRSRRRVTDD